MKRTFNKFGIVLLFLFGINLFAYPQQTSCSVKLEEAEKLYESGILDSIPSMLRACINSGFDDDELSRAYKLLILTYLFEDYQETAEITMLKFLKKFPEYELKATDPVEFKYLYESYKTIPVYSIGVIFGGNYSYVRVLEPYSLYNTNNYEGEYSSSGIGYQVGLQLKRYITDKIEINLDAIYCAKNFKYNLKQLDSELEYIENLTGFSFPLTATYDFKYKRFTPFVRAGVNVDYLMSASADFKRVVNSEAGIDDLKNTGVNVLNERNTFNFSLVVGGGVKVFFKKGYLMFDVRYYEGLTNNVAENSRYINDEKWANFQYQDDDFAMNNLNFSLGYVFTIYKTKKQ